MGKKQTLSISGKVRHCPEPGGYCIFKVLQTTFVGSQSPSKAQAVMSLPLFCRSGVSAMNANAGWPYRGNESASSTPETTASSAAGT